MLSIEGFKVPNKEQPFHFCYDPKADALVALNSPEFDWSHGDSNVENDRLLVPTSNLQITHTIIQPWLENKQHVLLIGPEASAKRYGFTK